MSKFNLIEDKWIPVRFLDGTRDELGLGISETLLRSREIMAIEDPSPLVEAALYRFLLAVLYRALEGPTDIDQAKTLFRDGLPGEKVTGYLKKWWDRFYIFDENHPFGQIPTFKPKTWRAWTTLAAEHNADTAKILFDHVNESEPGSISPSAAARWLLATQTFAVSTGNSEMSYTGKAPSTGSVMAIPIGLNLMDTLIFCLVPQNREVMQTDIPSWEKEPESLEYLTSTIKVADKKTGKDKNRFIERGAIGIVDLYTWRTRSVLLKESPSGMISKVGFASGVGYKESTELDPMLGYRIVEVTDEETKEKVKKRMAIQFEERGIWRDFDSLLPDDAHLAPKVIENAVVLTRMDRKRLPRGVMVLGHRYFPPRPNIAFWRKEHFVLPEAISGDRNIRHDIRDCLEDAKRVGEELSSACETFAKNILRHDERKVEKKDVRNCVEQLTAPDEYWSVLEPRFHEILHGYTLEEKFEDIRCRWLISVREALNTAWRQFSALVSTGDIWTIRAFVKAEGPLLRKLAELNEEINKIKP